MQTVSAEVKRYRMYQITQCPDRIVKTDLLSHMDDLIENSSDIPLRKRRIILHREDYSNYVDHVRSEQKAGRVHKYLRIRSYKGVPVLSANKEL
jgi:hypothetical protein